MRKKIMVVGAGFRGFCDCLHLLESDEFDITLVDTLPFFGGVLNSIQVGNYFVDRGVHIFDSIPIKLAEVVETIMKGQVHEIDFSSASAFNSKITRGFSLPDLDSLDDDNMKEKIRSELMCLSKNSEEQKTNTTLQELFKTKFGETAGEKFCQIFKKVYNIAACEVEETAIAQTSMGRLKFLNDEQMLELKKDPYLDTILAARRKTMGKIDDLVSIYPSDGKAMKGWCDNAVEWLREKGVKVLLDTKILSITESASGLDVETNLGKHSIDKLIWSNDSLKPLSSALGLDHYPDDLQYGTPMLFATLVTKSSEIADLTYLQNFDPDQITYRTAASGLFSKQISGDGSTFLTAECPVEIGSADWNEPEKTKEKIWAEVKNLGVVSQKAELISADVKRIPKTFKLAKVGFNKEFQRTADAISETCPNIVVRNATPFFRRDIYQDSSHLVNMVG